MQQPQGAPRLLGPPAAAAAAAQGPTSHTCQGAGGAVDGHRGDQAQGALAADEELLQVIAGRGQGRWKGCV